MILPNLYATFARASFPGANAKILYVRAVSGTHQVFAMNPDGTARTQLTYLANGADSPAASADGTRIAFGSNGNIWAMNADGSETTQLTSTRKDYAPAWSADGTHLAIERHTSGIRLVVLDADGSNQTVITGPNIWAFEPDWSPDGTVIAFGGVKLPGGVMSIYTVRPDGAGLTRVPVTYSKNTIEGASEPTWSPDGAMLGFSAQPLSQGRPICPDPAGVGIQCLDIYAVSSTGGTPTRLTQDRRDDFHPSWSPDGKRIAFNHNSISGGCASGCIYDIYRMTSDGSHKHNLTRTPNINEQASFWATATGSRSFIS